MMVVAKAVAPTLTESKLSRHEGHFHSHQPPPPESLPSLPPPPPTAIVYQQQKQEQQQQQQESSNSKKNSKSKHKSNISKRRTDGKATPTVTEC